MDFLIIDLQYRLQYVIIELGRSFISIRVPFNIKQHLAKETEYLFCYKTIHQKFKGILLFLI
jgi:hypothetical protein